MASPCGVLNSDNRSSGRYAPSGGCDRSRSSNQIGAIIRDKDSELYEEMKLFWPSAKGDNNWFWSHEWTKHGTCVSTLRPTCFGTTYTKYDDVTAYFWKVLSLHQEHDIYAALNLAGVIPGYWYNVDTIRDALQQRFKSRVKLSCNRNGHLSEVSLYFYVAGRDSYELTNAPQLGNCHGPVYYAKKD
ncbi:ribonuclease T2-like [Apophysomyces ossiformis]|uniref:ribonuclease T2 n=1 Tax=Apophysomyces ossiformis TaxID=679940 RepID=A0A8H7BPG5_9FUNG|nr:ribonuclease T2-like [Apophysomyces ossiformis]